MNNADTSETTGQPRKESTVAQGTKFELKVAKILEAYGYKVRHNVLVKGVSGAEHQIDVIAEHRGTLHRDFLVVECKAYGKGHNIEKDILMKQLNICNEIGYGGIMIFTTSDFMSGCITIAQQYNHVTLVNGDMVDSLAQNIDIDDQSESKSGKRLYVKPFVSESKAKKYAKSRAKKMSGGMLRKRPKVTVKSVTLVCYPYHTVRYHHEKAEKRGLFRRTEVLRKIPHEVSVDARTGTVADVEKGKGVSYRLEFIKDLKPDEITLLQHANKKKMITGQEIKLSGISKETASTCLPRLHGLGHVSRLSMKDVSSWKANKTIPSGLRSIPQAYAKHMQEHPPGIRVESIVPLAHAIQVIKWLGDKADGVTTAYYPFYDIRYEDDQGIQYNEMLDAINGRETGSLRDTMSEWKLRETQMNVEKPGVVPSDNDAVAAAAAADVKKADGNHDALNDDSDDNYADNGVMADDNDRENTDTDDNDRGSADADSTCTNDNVANNNNDNNASDNDTNNSTDTNPKSNALPSETAVKKVSWTDIPRS